MKRILTIIILIFSSLILTSTLYGASGDAEKLMIHYYRYDGGGSKTHYAWLWQSEPNPNEGLKQDLAFVEDTDPLMEGWLLLEVDLTIPEFKGVTLMGIIIKDGTGWSGVKQEPGDDRFIDFKDHVKDGIMHAYFVQTDPTIYYALEDAVINNVIFSADFTLERNVDVSVSEVPESYKLYEGDNVIHEGTSDDKNFIVNLVESSINIDISKHYFLEVTFSDITQKSKVSLRRLYDTDLFSDAFHYDGELGAIYEKDKTTFKVWSPNAEKMSVLIYNQSHPQYDLNGNKKPEPFTAKVIPLNHTDKGVFEGILEGDNHGKYYVIESESNGIKERFIDPYAKSSGANGERRYDCWF